MPCAFLLDSSIEVAVDKARSLWENICFVPVLAPSAFLAISLAGRYPSCAGLAQEVTRVDEGRVALATKVAREEKVVGSPALAEAVKEDRTRQGQSR